MSSVIVPLSPTSNQKDRMNYGDTCVFDRDEFQEHVKCSFSKCRFSAELVKFGKICEMGGSVEK